jgi:hypothetical protein
MPEAADAKDTIQFDGRKQHPVDYLEPQITAYRGCPPLRRQASPLASESRVLEGEPPVGLRGSDSSLGRVSWKHSTGVLY